MKMYPGSRALLGALASTVAASSAYAGECPTPVSTQGVETSGGTYTVSAQVEIKPALWVANAGEDTVSKIATDVNKEVARYSTKFWTGGIGGNGAGFQTHDPWNGPAPSRSSVDTDGNAYVANRGFNRYAEVMKILSTGCIDRNNNGTCETSSDLNNDGKISQNEMYPVKDDNGNGIIEDSEIRDERVAWIRRVGNYNEVARALAIDKNGDLWVGMFNTGRVYKVDPSNGATLGFWSIGAQPYGAAVDSQGRLFTAGLGNSWQRRIDTANPATQAWYFVEYGYGLAVGKDHNNKEWVITAHHNNKGFQRTDPNTLNSVYPLGWNGFTAYGISFDKTGHVVFSGAQYWGTRGATKARTDGSVVWTRAPATGCQSGDQRGAIVDANNDIWVVSLNNHRVCKYLANGTTDAQVPVGLYPYTYSDASGIGLAFSDPTGKVIFQSDAVGPDFNWAGAPVCFQGSGNVTLSAAAANTEAGLGFANPQSVALTQNGSQLCGTIPAGVVGRYISLTFTIKSGGTLVVSDTTTGQCTIDLPEANKAPVAVCQSADVCANDQCVAVANVDGGSSDPDGDALNMSVDPNGPYGLGQTLVTLSVSDGKATTQCQATVTVKDCTAPAMACPGDVVAECTGNGSAQVDPGAASATDNCGQAAVAQPGTGTYGLGATSVSFSATDGSGNTSTCSSTVTVQDTTAPSIKCPAAFTAECTGNGSATVTPGAASASDVCGAVTVDNPGTASFSLGTTSLTYTATDAQGLSSSCKADVTVVDTTKPTVTVAAAGAGELWPPNHDYHTISLADCGIAVQDVCDGSLSLSAASAAITCVSSDELENSKGDGNTTQDIVLLSATTVQVRAERDGGLDGRVYSIGFEVRDGAGNVSSGVCKVAVNKSQGPKGIAIDSGAKYTVCK